MAQVMRNDSINGNPKNRRKQDETLFFIRSSNEFSGLYHHPHIKGPLQCQRQQLWCKNQNQSMEQLIRRNVS
jgi:hypothetical protein